MNREHPDDSRIRRFGWSLVVALLGGSHAAALRWISDDAYISLRYARNWVEGFGLVFNPGERVEGYTNFLWTSLLALGLKLEFPPEELAIGLGLIGSTGCLLALLRLRRFVISPAGSVPFSLLALALSYTWASFATGGLETSLLGLLLVASFLLLFEGARASDTSAGRRKLVLAGVSIALAAMTRPDAVLLLPVAFGYLISKLRTRRSRVGALALVVVPLALLYFPYFLWRLNYYGYFFPNTYYAKAIDVANYRQGWLYLWEFVRCDYVWALLPWPLIGVWRIRRREGRLEYSALLAFCILHIAYVVRVGGDFMEGRFFVPVLPPLYLLTEWSLRELLPARAAAAALVVMVALTAVGHRALAPRAIEHGITDERSWASIVQVWRGAGAAFAKHLPPDTRVATDAIGAFGFASGLPVVDTHGLTDEFVGHQPLDVRRRPGHEKVAGLAYLARRKVAILRDVGLYRMRRPADFEYGGNHYYLMTKRRDVVEGFERAVAELKAAANPARDNRPRGDARRGGVADG
jgi:arabinofuranosyltransferase